MVYYKIDIAQSSGDSTALADAMVANGVIASTSDVSVAMVKTKVAVIPAVKPLDHTGVYIYFLVYIYIYPS